MNNRSNGSALIVSIMLILLVAMFSTAIVLSEKRLLKNIRLIDLVRKNELCIALARNWSIQVIKMQPKKAAHKININYSGCKVSATLVDLQNRFNVNLLKSGGHQSQFVRFMGYVFPNMSHFKIEMIAKNILSWIDGSANSHYKMLSQVGELRNVNGMTQKIFLRLRPYIAALPTTQPLKLNFMDLDYYSLPLMASFHGSDMLKANNILSCLSNLNRAGSNVFSTKSCFDKLAGTALSHKFGTVSRYYILSARSVSKNVSTYFKWFIMVPAHEDERHSLVEIVWQKIN